MNKVSGGDRIPAELFQIQKDDAVKVLHSICQQIWKFQQWPQDWKRSVFIPIPKKGNAKKMFKLPYNYFHFICQQGKAQNPSNQASTVSEPNTSRCTNWIQQRQRKRDIITNIHWIIEKTREFHKTISYINYTKAFYCVHDNKLEIHKDVEISDHLTCFL